MKQLVQTIKKKEQEQKERLAVLKLEMNYQLAELYEAMQDKDEDKIRKCKEKLQAIRKELIQLNGL